MPERKHRTIEFLLPSPSGELEALLTIPESTSNVAAIICHPHPLYGGTMHGKVVFTVSQALAEMGIPSLRFNFRGVGRSSGRYDGGRGEQDDVKAAADYMAKSYDRLIVAGHSFGARMGMKAGCGDAHVEVILGIGTPANFVDMGFLMDCTKPRLFIHGTVDKLIPIAKVEELYRTLPGPKKLISIKGADHFFTGKLGELSEAVRKMVEEFLTYPQRRTV